MPHTISFKHQHISIHSLEEVELPDFALVTGINGSGKSHLLSAITKSAITSDAIRNQSEATLLTWETLAPKDQKEAKPGEFGQFASKIARNLEEFANGSKTASIHSPHSLLGQHIRCSDLLERASHDDGTNKQSISNEIKQAMGRKNESKAVVSQKHDPAQLFFNKLNDDVLVRLAPVLLGQDNIARREAVLALELSTPPGFEQDLNRIFQRHRDLENRNLIAEHRGEHDRIIEIDGPAPWDFLNDLFKQGDINFRVERPDYVALNSSVRVKLRKIGSDAEIRFAELSSGERIFISFAIALYNTESAKTAAVFPKLLLLDEIDATLHPSMVKYVLKVIKETLVNKLGIKVILTTHSPTTVALVADDEVYEMDNTQGQLRHVGRSRALGLLTEAIPTLAIDYDARILVITESENDAKLWSKLYETVRAKLDSEKSLTFIGSGVKNKKGEAVGSGCVRVREVVTQMTEAKFPRVTGLVDWDCRNESAEGEAVHVHSANQRYAIENLLLDPVLCIILMCSVDPDAAFRAGLIGEGEGLLTLHKWDIAQWQRKSDMFCQKVFPGGDLSVVDQVDYANDKSLSIPQAYLRHDAHKLEDKVKEAYSCLKAHRYQNGVLPEVVKLIARGDAEEWYPRSIIDTMDALIKLGSGTTQPASST